MKVYITLLILFFTSSLFCFADTPTDANLEQRTFIVKNDTSYNSLRLFHTNLQKASSTEDSKYIINFQNTENEKTNLDLSKVYELSLYLQSSTELEINISFFGKDGSKIDTYTPVILSLPASTGKYISIPLGIAANSELLSEVASLELTITSKESQYSYLLDEIELHYFEESKEKQQTSSITKQILEDKYEDYLDIKRDEGFGHQRKVEAKKNNQ